MQRYIVNFHGIGAPDRELEPGEAPYWIPAEFYHEILDLAARMADRAVVAFTFDDGNRSDVEIGAPGLERHGFKGQFFPLAARLGSRGSVSEKDLRTLTNAGHEIGSHGADHVDWKALDTAGQEREWDWARQVISEASGQPVSSAAIPFGRYNAGVLRGLSGRGYSRVYSSDGGAARSDAAPIPRTSVRNDTQLSDLEALLAGRESGGRRLRRGLARFVKSRR